MINFQDRLDLGDDGSFKLWLIFQPCADSDYSHPDGWANVIVGSSEYRAGVLTLHPVAEEDDNPAVPLGLYPRRFRVTRSWRHTYLENLAAGATQVFHK